MAGGDYHKPDRGPSYQDVMALITPILPIGDHDAKTYLQFKKSASSEISSYPALRARDSVHRLETAILTAIGDYVRDQGSIGCEMDDVNEEAMKEAFKSLTCGKPEQMADFNTYIINHNNVRDAVNALQTEAVGLLDHLELKPGLMDRIMYQVGESIYNDFPAAANAAYETVMAESNPRKSSTGFLGTALRSAAYIAIAGAALIGGIVAEKNGAIDRFLMNNLPPDYFAKVCPYLRSSDQGGDVPLTSHDLAALLASGKYKVEVVPVSSTGPIAVSDGDTVQILDRKHGIMSPLELYIEAIRLIGEDKRPLPKSVNVVDCVDVSELSGDSSDPFICISGYAGGSSVDGSVETDDGNTSGSDLEIELNVPPPIMPVPGNTAGTPAPKPECSDGINQGTDRVMDRDDPGCYDTGRYDPNDPSEEDTLPQCSNFFDDDHDGLTDYPKDPGCSGPNDRTETRSRGASRSHGGRDHKGSNPTVPRSENYPPARSRTWGPGTPNHQ